MGFRVIQKSITLNNLERHSPTPGKRRLATPELEISTRPQRPCGGYL